MKFVRYVKQIRPRKYVITVTFKTNHYSSVKDVNDKKYSMPKECVKIAIVRNYIKRIKRSISNTNVIGITKTVEPSDEGIDGIIIRSMESK